ncbi:MAG: hypothetical protein H0W97_06420 [Actinobacteria bacterium]|nr:hypothetical protein [Actinomycetota bacterium]
MDEHPGHDADVTSAREGDLGPPNPPPPPPKRRRRMLETIGVIAIVLVGLGIVGAIIGPENGVIFREDFESDEVVFSTDSDRFVDLSVVDGAYQVTIKDGSIPQLVRYVFDNTHDGVSFQATIVHPAEADEDTFASVGCWASDSAYQLVMAPDGDVGLLETVSERTGERLALTELIPSSAARQTGQPNRLRIDCVSEGKDDTVVSGYVNGEAVLSVAIPGGYDSFNAVGFFLTATDGARFTIDDVMTSAGRPEPGMSPVPPREDR